MKKLFFLLALTFCFNARAGIEPATNRFGYDVALDPPPFAPPPVAPEPGGRKLDYVLATGVIMISVAATLIIWDIFLAKQHATTESQIITQTAWKYSSIPFVAGVLIGHWFFTHTSYSQANLWPVMAASVAAVVVWDIVRPPVAGNSMTRYPGLWFCVGVPIGAIFWGQRHNPEFNPMAIQW
jgi:hypothetical protein